MEEREIEEIDGIPESLGEEDQAYTVSQVNQGIAAALERAFSQSFWVVGEIQEYSRNAEAAKSRKWGQVYFELVEKEEGKDQFKAKIRAMMWGSAHDKMLAKLRQADPKLALQDGLQVRILCRVNFYWKWGDLRLQAEDIDPNFTLGEMERARRELIKKLKASGLFDKNRSTTLPEPALNLGLITAEASAAYHDFTDELRRSGFSFRLFFWRASMQGEGTEGSVVQGLKTLSRMEEVEAVVIIRGGGSRSDLIWFDKEAIALAIAECPKPVLTGIGHEIDQSVADLVAFQTFKTPTAIAQFFVQQCGEFEIKTVEAARKILNLSKETLLESRHALARFGQMLLAESRRGLAVGGEKLRSVSCAIQSSAFYCLGTERLRLGEIPGALARSIQRLLREKNQALEMLEKECRFKDPMRLLQRGYSLAFDASGRLVKSARGLEAGDALQIRFAEGTADAEIKKLNLKEA